jgi:hypothetical protein
VSQLVVESHSVITLQHTGHASNNKKASVPWTEIAKNPDKFFDDDYLPFDVTLVEISKMKSEALQSCYSFWHARQKAGDDAFLFKHVHPSDFRITSKKRKSTDDPQEEGSGQHMIRHQSTPDHQEEGTGQHATTSELPPSASPEPHPLYALILLFSSCLSKSSGPSVTPMTNLPESLIPHPHHLMMLQVFQGKPKLNPLKCNVHIMVS